MSGIIGVDLNQRSGVLGGTWNYTYTTTFLKNFNTSGASEDISYTGVGFKPSLINFVASSQDNTSRSWGYDDGTTHLCLMTQFTLHTSATPGANTANMSIHIHDTATAGIKAIVKSMDADGFTLTYYDIGDPASTRNCSIMYTAFR